MSTKVTGKNAHVLAYFSSVLAAIAMVGLAMFAMQWYALAKAGIAGLLTMLTHPSMLATQFMVLAILAPAVAFCAYLALRLQLSSRYFQLALRVAAVVMLPVAPWVTLLGLFTFWLSFK